jgi:predicted ABC-type transport system involved in lysophospholipase L1 biosynthesis ATPase subunit
VARALIIINPVIADEPSGNLDRISRKPTPIIFKLRDEFGVNFFVIVT